MPKNIFVLGLDEVNRETLQDVPRAHEYAFHQLLTIDELQHGEEIPVGELIDKATSQLQAFDGSIDAIIGYWDFPVSSMVPILCRRFGLRSSTLESRLKCEHKYWARVEQSKVVKDIPAFVAVDPFDDDSVAAIDLRYPYWIKPVKSFSSELAERVEGAHSLEQAITDVREHVGRVGEAFDYVLHQLDEIPPEIDELGGTACIAEEEAHGEQCTVEGYRHGGETLIYGLFDSVRYPDTSSFLRFEYPSHVPAHLQERMREDTQAIIEHVDLDDSTFNIEFFWDADAEEVTVLEVNPRHSQSHAPLLEYVDGFPNHKIMIDLALDNDPQLPHGQGPYEHAAKWFLRHFVEDGVVTRAPTDEEVRAVEERVPGAMIDVLVSEGDRLSDLHDQDPYSYKIANVFVGAATRAELIDKYEQCVEELQFDFDE